MSNLIDSHCHLHCLPLDKLGLTLPEVIDKAKQSGVEKMITVSIDAQSLSEVIKIAESYPEVYASSGIHPSDVNDVSNEEWAQIEKAAKNSKVVAIGETGLDYYHSGTQYAEVQQKSFERHIEIAKGVGKPLIIHSRSAREDTLKTLKDAGAKEVGGVMHCFTESLEMAKAAIELNFYISFSGIITFKNAKDIQEVVAALPLERILVETDAPYLAPVPFRGKVNQPAYVYYVAKQLAELKGLSFEKVVEQTTANSCQLFGL